MKIKYISLGLFAVAGLAFAAATMTVDTTTSTLENAPNCSKGIRKISDDSSILQYYPTGILGSNNFYGCYANPKEFHIKIYGISLLDANDVETVLYAPTSPEYVNIISKRFNPVKDVSNLTDGTTYTKVKLVVDAYYKVKIDELIASDTSGGSSRVISYDDGGSPPNGKPVPYPNMLTALGVEGVTGNGSANAPAFFRRDASTPASLTTFMHNGFLVGSSNMSLSQVGYGYKYLGNPVVKDYSNNCYVNLTGAVVNFCSDAQKASLTPSTGGFYPMQADWDLSSSNKTISHVTHSINLDANGAPIDFFSGSDENYSWARTPKNQARRATITLTLKNPYTYDSSKGTVINWKWLTKNLFWLGMHRNSFETQTDATNTIRLLGIGPYGLDLSITAVPRKRSGLADTTDIPSN